LSRRRPDEVAPHGHRQTEEWRLKLVDRFWIANPLETIRHVAAAAGTSRDTAWESRKGLEAAGLLRVMSRRERGLARNIERFSQLNNDPNSNVKARPRTRRPKGSPWWNLTQIVIKDPVTGQVRWRSPKFPDLSHGSGLPGDGFVEQLEKALLQSPQHLEQMVQAVFPAKRAPQNL
jgi:hypothetical protein